MIDKIKQNIEINMQIIFDIDISKRMSMSVSVPKPTYENPIYSLDVCFKTMPISYAICF